MCRPLTSAPRGDRPVGPPSLRHLSVKSAGTGQAVIIIIIIIIIKD